MKTAVALKKHSTERSTGPLFHIYVDGAGMRPFSEKGSGYGWLNKETGDELVKWIDGWTCNQAEYRALLSAVKHIPEGTEAEIFSDSMLVVNQYSGDWMVKDPVLQRLLDRVKEVIQERRLRVVLTWVPRERNLAGKLLER